MELSAGVQDINLNAQEFPGLPVSSRPAPMFSSSNANNSSKNDDFPEFLDSGNSSTSSKKKKGKKVLLHFG
jgi:hypothetical protein